MSVYLVLSAVYCCAVILSAVFLATGIKKMRRLGDIDISREEVDSRPLVSIIVPACNEEEHIEQALQTLLAQDYQNLEIIVVNDRSTDNTGRVLEDLKADNPRLIILEVTSLPEGWMGKSHALATGAALAKGVYLVFTDADVLMEKTAISRAVQCAVDDQLDHLTLVFKNISGGWLLNSLILDAGMGLLFLFRPWAAKVTGGRAFVGIGAFNMVKSSAYDTVGGHERIRMHPIDDMMLGKMIKNHGFRQDCLLAYDFVTVPWYNSVKAMVNGLQKNMFAVLHYRLLLIPAVLFFIVTVAILPFLGAILGKGLLQAVCLFTVVVRLAGFSSGLRTQGLPAYYLPGAVITPYISIYILLKSVFTTLYQRGIFWRGQHYALEDMKKSEPLLF
jgi:glycosyltransferase involved in cell wall biosynthesis